MKVDRRTQADRTAATRQALIAAGRALFAAKGYAEVGTEEIVQAAGVTRGALYHHFADKKELFAAVFETVEGELIAQIRAEIGAVESADPIELMRIGCSAWLDVCRSPGVARIALLDSPAVLGWMRWREIGGRYSMALVEGLLGAAIQAGRLPAQPIEPLANVLLGAVREAAVYLAAAPDPAQARSEVGAVMDRMILSLAGGTLRS
jgi:AcrR family transcriptional regulator